MTYDKKNVNDEDQSQTGESGASASDRRFHDRMMSMAMDLTPVRWKLFHNPHVTPNLERDYQQFHYHERDLKLQPLVQIEPWDLCVIDADYGQQYELRNDPNKLIILALKPLYQFQPAFESFLKRLVPEIPDVANVSVLKKQGYQFRCDLKLGALMIRMPNPEQMIRFAEELSLQQYINITAPDLAYEFSRGLLARYDKEMKLHPQLKPTPKEDAAFHLKKEYQLEVKKNPHHIYQPRPELIVKKTDKK